MAGPDGDHTWIQRTHLLPRLTAARVVLLDAPGGWGKSTLAEQLIAATGSAALRVRVHDDCDTDGLVAGLRRAARRAGVTQLAEAVQAGDPDDQLDELLGRLVTRDEPATLFVDEAHLLQPAAIDWLRSLCDDIAAPHRVVVSGRGLPRLLTRRLRADCVLLGTPDLRFSQEEVALVAGLATPEAAQLLSRTDGWPAAVAVAAATAGGHVAGSSDTPDATMAVLLDELLGPDRERLAPLALPPLLSPAVCELAAGAGAFDRLMTSGLPTRTVGEWRALPDPVREVLGAGAVLPPGTPLAIAQQYDLATSIAFLVGLDELDVLAASLAERHWSELLELSVGEVEAVDALLGDERTMRHPQLLLAAARAAELRKPDARAAWIERGLAGAPTGPLHRAFEAERARDAVRNWEADAGDRCRALLAALSADETETRARVLLALGIVHGFRSSPDELALAEQHFGEAVGLFRVLGESRWEAEALNRVATMVSYHGGRAALAAEQQAQSVALLPAGTRDWAVGLTYYSDVLDFLGRTGEADAAAREAWEVGRRLGDPVTIAYAAWSLAIVRAHAGDLDGTRRWLREAEANPGNWFGQVSGQELLAYGADLLGCLGDRDGAYEYRARVLARVGDGGTQELADVVDGRLEAMYGDPERAVALIERLDGEPYATIRAKWVRLLFRALAAKRLGDRAAATRGIVQSLDLVDQMGVSGLPQRHEPVLVQMLADVWPGGAERSASGQVRVVLLGGFAVVRGVDLVTPSPGNPATLVKLLALKGTLTSEQVIDALWPEADVATGRARLRNLLNRVRTQSGELIVRQGDALALAPEIVVDAAQFEAAVATVFDAPSTERAGLARLALGAYAGELLPADAYEDWAAGPRERLRRRYLSLVDVVAEHALGRGDIDEGVRLLDLGIEAEPLEERRYLVAARALLGRGRRSAARDVVQRAVATFAELGLRPSGELGEIGRSLDVEGAG